jgi:hypothetical protein
MALTAAQSTSTSGQVLGAAARTDLTHRTGVLITAREATNYSKPGINLARKLSIRFTVAINS